MPSQRQERGALSFTMHASYMQQHNPKGVVTLMIGAKIRRLMDVRRPIVYDCSHRLPIMYVSDVGVAWTGCVAQQAASKMLAEMGTSAELASIGLCMWLAELFDRDAVAKQTHFYASSKFLVVRCGFSIRTATAQMP